MNKLLKYKLLLTGIAVGAAGGYAYYYFVGCSSGTCLITSHPFNSTAYGALMGALLSGVIRKEKPNQKIKENEKK
jgi:phage shock protein E